MVKKSDYLAAAIITSAGKSSRMGRPKALLPFDKNITFVEQIVATYCRKGIRPLVVTNENLSPLLSPIVSKAGGEVAAKAQEEWQMIDSIRYGLASLKETDLPLFIQPVDMPFVSPELLTAMANLAAKKSERFIIPSTPLGLGHPLFIPEKWLSWIKSPATDPGLQKALSEVSPAPILLPWGDERLALNINTPEDYKRSGLFHLACRPCR